MEETETVTREVEGKLRVMSLKPREELYPRLADATRQLDAASRNVQFELAISNLFTQSNDFVSFLSSKF